MKLNKMPNISFVVEHDLCTGCGICVNSCVSKAIVMSVKKGRFLLYESTYKKCLREE